MFSLVMGDRRGYIKVMHISDRNKKPILVGTTAEGIAIHLSVSDHLSVCTVQGCACSVEPHSHLMEI